MTDPGAPRMVTSGRIHAPRGTKLSCKGWEQEAALRMLLNCANSEMAERAAEPDADTEDFQPTVAALRELRNDETLLVQSGKAAGVFRTAEDSPRVLIASEAATSSVLCAAAGWLCAGPQLGLPQAFEGLETAAHKHFGATLAGRLIVTCGMGTTGAALPLAATLNGAAFLGLEPDVEQIKRRVKTGYCEVLVNDLDEALRILKNSVRKREPASVGLLGNAADLVPEMARRGIVPNLLIDCSTGIRLFESYVPSTLSPAAAGDLRHRDSKGYREKVLRSVDAQVRGMLELKRLGSLVYRFEAGPYDHGQGPAAKITSEVGDFAAEYIEPLFSGRRALLIWVGLSGEPSDLTRADRLAREVFAEDQRAARWIALAEKNVQVQGLPARVCIAEPAIAGQFGRMLNEMVAHKTAKAPFVIGACQIADHAVPSSGEAGFERLVASLTAADKGASWVAIPATDGARDIRSWIARAIVADGTADVASRMERALG